eukprot:111758-Chlamydomonas_euryale.AAC.1
MSVAAELHMCPAHVSPSIHPPPNVLKGAQAVACHGTGQRGARVIIGCDGGVRADDHRRHRLSVVRSVASTH